MATAGRFRFVSACWSRENEQLISLLDKILDCNLWILRANDKLEGSEKPGVAPDEFSKRYIEHHQRDREQLRAKRAKAIKKLVELLESEARGDDE